MSAPIPHDCITMRAALENVSAPIEYSPEFREFAVLCSPTPTVYVFEWCPWCGEKLPASLRDEFFDEIWAMGHEIEDASLPDKYHSDAWWRKQD